MKRPLYLAVSGTILSMLIFSSCSDSDKNSPQPVAKAGSMIATVDGVSWESAQASAMIANGSITVVGLDSKGTGIELAVFKGITTGKYDVKGVEAGYPDASVSLTPDGEYAYASVYYPGGTEVGTITITEINETSKTISGNFSVKVKRTVPAVKEVEIKSGSFTKISYDTEPASGTNTFSAKVDGAALTATVIGGLKALGKITLNFSNADASKIISIVVPDNVATGSHNFGSFGDTYFATYTKSNATNESVSGSVNISLHNTSTKRIEGTFSFSAEPFPLGGTAVSITDGSFEVTYN